MRRRQLFEFTDLPWIPAFVRGMLTEYLLVLMDRARPFTPKVSLIAEALQATNQNQIVDLCSGSGGPWFHLARELRSLRGDDTAVLLTDKYVNEHTVARVAAVEGLSYSRSAVDALNVPQSLQGVRTLINGFHHFSPEIANQIIADAVRRKQGIVVFEMLQRTWPEFFFTSLSVVSLLLLTPLIKPRRVSRFLFTYLIPVAPAVVLWDSLVSTMRCYTPTELLAMGRQASGDRYLWSAGSYRWQGLPVTFLVGYPTAPSTESESDRTLNGK